MLHSGNRGGLIHVFLAAWMIARTHVAVSCHLLAAFHFDLRHGRFRNTCEGRRSRPDQDQNERQDGTARRHDMMLHLRLRAVKEMCEQTGSSGITWLARNFPQDPILLASAARLEAAPFQNRPGLGSATSVSHGLPGQPLGRPRYWQRRRSELPRRCGACERTP
jgi:hypothetical protein